MTRFQRMYMRAVLAVGTARWWREAVLTIGAVLGVVGIVFAIASAAFDVRPLVFRSGSMSPAIDTGALAISRTVDARELTIGDIVSVLSSEGVRITHRIVDVDRQGSAATLTLKGDDNAAPDAEVYPVTSAERVLFDIPRAGYVLSAVSGPVGIFLLGAYVAFLAMVLRGPAGGHGRGGGRRRRATSSVLGVAVLLAGAGGAVGLSRPAGTLAAWVDSANVAGGAFGAAVLSPPATPQCGAPLVGAPSFSWAAPTQGPAPDGYRITYSQTNVLGVLQGSGTVTQTGTTWTVPSSLLTLAGRITVSVQSVAFSTWYSIPSGTASANVTLGLGGLVLASCA